MSSSNRCKAAHQPKLTCPRRSRRVQFKTAHPNLHRRGPGPIRHRREVRHPIPILHPDFAIAWPYGSCGITVWVGSAPAFLLELAGYFMPTALETNSSRHIVTGPVKVARCTELNCPLNTKTIDKGLWKHASYDKLHVHPGNRGLDSVSHQKSVGVGPTSKVKGETSWSKRTTL